MIYLTHSFMSIFLNVLVLLLYLAFLSFLIYSLALIFSIQCFSMVLYPTQSNFLFMKSEIILFLSHVMKMCKHILTFIPLTLNNSLSNNFILLLFACICPGSSSNGWNTTVVKWMKYDRHDNKHWLLSHLYPVPCVVLNDIDVQKVSENT